MLNSAQPFEVVLPWDPAFNAAHDECDYREFYKTRDHEKYLRLHPGARPMRFELRPLTHSQVARFIATAKTEDEQRILAFWLSVQAVHDGTYRNGHVGEKTPVRVAELGADSLKRTDFLWTPEECDAHFDYATVQDIGGVALTRAFFDSPWTSPPYQLPPTSVAAQTRYLSRLAEEAKRLADEATSSSRDAPEPGPTSSASGAEPGAATATELPTSAKAGRRTRRSKSAAR